MGHLGGSPHQGFSEAKQRPVCTGAPAPSALASRRLSGGLPPAPARLLPAAAWPGPGVSRRGEPS